MDTSSAPADPSRTKPAKKFSCVRCFDRKVKCTKQLPCTACIKAGVDCVFRQPAPPRRRKKRSPEELLLARLRRYETLLQQHGISIESIQAKDLDVGPDQDDPDVSSEGGAALLGSDAAVKADPDATAAGTHLDRGRLLGEQGRTKFYENHLWSGLGEELQSGDDVLEHSSEYESDETSRDATAYGDGPHAIGFLLGFSQTNAPLVSLHPLPEHVYKLWHIFLENVNPLTKLVHHPTLQGQIFEASFNLEKVPKGLEALMFAVYTSAVNSITEKDCWETFNEDKSTLLTRYHVGLRKALVRANFLATSELAVLQAFAIYLLSMRLFYDPRTMWILAGVASRVAQSLGLHRDGSTLGLSPFDAEMRRRVWWQIIILDNRAAELSGSARAVDVQRWDTHVPANVNDADLYPLMTAPPLEFEGATEMISCSMRYELGNHIRRSHMLIKERFNGDWQVANPGVPIDDKDKLIDGLEKRLEEKYVRYCDPSIPIHFHTLIVTRAVISSMRLMAHHPRHRSDQKRTLSPKESDMMFTWSLKVLECDNLCHSTPAFRGFLWYSQVLFQWQAFIYLLGELRQRTEGAEVEKAWGQIEQGYENHPTFITDTRRPLHMATGNLCLKAWNAREHAVSMHTRSGFPPRIPSFITTLRQQRSRTRQSSAVAGKDAAAWVPGPHGSGLRGPMPAESHVENAGAALGASVEFDAGMLADFSMDEISPMNWEEWDSLVQNYEAPNPQDWVNMGKQ